MDGCLENGPSLVLKRQKKNKKKRSETGGMKRIVQVCLSLLVEHVRLVAYKKKFELHNVCM